MLMGITGLTSVSVYFKHLYLIPEIHSRTECLHRFQGPLHPPWRSNHPVNINNQGNTFKKSLIYLSKDEYSFS